jgi:hypothetical protein
LSIEFIIEFKDKINVNDLIEKYGYKLITVEKFIIRDDNYYSNVLDYSEVKDLLIKLISLKAFK